MRIFCEAANTRKVTFRARHDALRDLWHLLSRPSPPDRVIRNHVSRLPAAVMAVLDRRALRHWPRLELNSPPEGGLQAWVKTAPAAELVALLRLLVAEGGVVVAGRGRGNGVRGADHLEPLIMGVVRGARGSGGPDGGPPKAEAEAGLVMNLALDWLYLTGEVPKSGRERTNAFGAIVHYVFELLGLDNASSSLRRYWDAVKQERNTPTRVFFED